MPIAATLCKYINYKARKRGHYQWKCECCWYPKHYHTTCCYTPVSHVPSEYVCVNRWWYQDVNSVACQPGETTVVNCLCKSNLNVLTLFALCWVSYYNTLQWLKRHKARVQVSDVLSYWMQIYSDFSIWNVFNGVAVFIVFPNNVMLNKWNQNHRLFLYEMLSVVLLYIQCKYTDCI